jgi:hypothetical protein
MLMVKVMRIPMVGMAMLLAWNSMAQLDSVAINYAASITEEDLRTHLTILASDDYQGRDTGKEGQKMAATYLRRAFERMGIPPIPPHQGPDLVDGYFQPFELIEERMGGLDVVSLRDTLAFLNELFYFNEQLVEDLPVSSLTYMGKASDLTASTQAPAGSRAFLFSGAGLPAEISAMVPLRLTMDWARKVEARVVVVVMDDLRSLMREMEHVVGGSRMRLAEQVKGEEKAKPQGSQLLLVDRTHADALLAKGRFSKLQRAKPGKKVPAAFTVRSRPQQQRVVSENVLAFIEGSDRKDEVVVITAHYDHVGVEDGVVYNGADDDGSGTVALLEIAQAFAKAKAAGHGPRRSILVMPVSGEEKGLLGSRHYSENPVFPLENTVADLNIDMIGRFDSVHVTSEPYVYVIGSDRLSTELHAVNEEANRLYVGLDLDYTFNAPDDPNRFYYRSDHYNFARKGVPSIFYFSGVHEDYHKPGDDVEKIRFDLLRQRTLLVFHTAWSLANRQGRVAVDKP